MLMLRSCLNLLMGLCWLLGDVPADLLGEGFRTDFWRKSFVIYLENCDICLVLLLLRCSFGVSATGSLPTDWMLSSLSGHNWCFGFLTGYWGLSTLDELDSFDRFDDAFCFRSDVLFWSVAVGCIYQRTVCDFLNCNLRLVLGWMCCITL